jgi:MFS family permease
MTGQRGKRTIAPMAKTATEQPPAVGSRVGTRTQLKLAAFWFGIYFLTGSFLAVVLPFLLVPEHPSASDPALVAASTKNTALAVLEGLGLIVALVVQPLAGAVSDRLWGRFGRRRPMMAIGVVVAVVALMLTGSAQTFWLLVGAYCLMQMAMNVAQGAYQGLLPDTVGSEDRGHASGLLGVAILSGQVAGIVTAGILAPRSVVYPIAAVLALSAAITILGVAERPIPPPPRAVQTERPPGARRAAVRAYFSEFRAYPDFCIVVASRFLIFTGLACVQRFAANYLRDNFHEYHLFGVISLGSAQSATAILFGVVILFGLLATYPAVKLSERVGRRPVLVAAALLGAAGTLSFTVAPSLSVILIEAIPIGICFGMLVSVDWAYMADLAPRNRSGKFLGFSNVAAVGAQSLVPFLMGPIIDLLDRGGGTSGYRVMFVCAAAFYVAGAAILRGVRLQRHPDADAPIALSVAVSGA